ncbi:MAG TPA: hypothetical protein VG322_09200 [Candidatus Acidoferrales bacterium]|jgi:hypothetical protein|nr:hypothetical protein [Candidatus Acidoferrales bacterium]
MRFAYFLIIAVLLGIVAGAQTMDDRDEFVFVRRQIRTSKSFVPQNGFIPDKNTAIAIAYAEAVPVYWKPRVDGEVDDSWYISRRRDGRHTYRAD